jgi:sulfonate transport system permease protein
MSGIAQREPAASPARQAAGSGSEAREGTCEPEQGRKPAFAGLHGQGQLIRFLLLVALGGLAIGMVKAATPLFALALGASKGEIGLITGTQPLVMVLVSLPIGLAVGHYGARRLFVVGSLAAAGIYAVVAGTDSPWWLLAATAAASFFMPMRFIATQSEFFHYLASAGSRGGKAGWLRGAQLGGAFVLGPMLGGTLVSWIGYEPTYWAIALVFLLPVILAPGVLSGRCEARRRRSAEEAGLTLRRLAGIFSHPEIAETSLIELVSHTALMFYTVFVVVLALEQFHVSREAATQLIAIQGFSFMSALFLLNGLLSRIGQGPFYGLSFGSAILGLLCLGAGRELLHLRIGGAFLGVGLGMLGIVNVVRLAAVSEKLGRGTVAGASSLSGPLGGMLGTLGGGFASQWIPLQHIFMGLTTAMTLIAIFTLYREKPGRTVRVLGWTASTLASVLGLSVYLLFPAALLLLWQLSAHYGWTSPQILPPPAVVFATLSELIANGDVTTNLGISLRRVFQGFALGSGIGLVLGFAMGLSRSVEAYLGPTFKGLASVPMLGWIPLLIILLGIDEGLKVAVIAIGCVVPVTLNTLEGVRGVPKGYVEVARVFRFSHWQLLRKVIFPAAIPPIFSGISLSLSHAWKAMVAVELMASSEGIGFLMVMGRQLFQLDVVLATILVIGSVGLVLDQLLRLTERHLTRWRPAVAR